MDISHKHDSADDGRVVAEVEEVTAIVTRSSDRTEVWAEMKRIISQGGRKAVVDVRKSGPAFGSRGLS
jgi:hypothetical protein